MTFVHVNNEAADDEFELIVVMNRDEFYDRRTIPVHKRTSNPSIISGQPATSILHLNCRFQLTVFVVVYRSRPFSKERQEVGKDLVRNFNDQKQDCVNASHRPTVRD